MWMNVFQFDTYSQWQKQSGGTGAELLPALFTWPQKKGVIWTWSQVPAETPRLLPEERAVMEA